MQARHYGRKMPFRHSRVTQVHALSGQHCQRKTPRELIGYLEVAVRCAPAGERLVSRGQLIGLKVSSDGSERRLYFTSGSPLPSWFACTPEVRLLRLL